LQLIRVVDKGLAKNAVANIAGSTSAAVLVKNSDDYLASYSAGGSSAVGPFVAKYPGGIGNSLQVSIADANTWSSWAYRANFDDAPSTSSYVSNLSGANDELHIIVIDQDGLFTGTTGTVLERFSYVSKASDAKKADGSSNYYKDVINSQSKYLWWLGHTANVVGTNNWGTQAAGTTFVNTTNVSNVTISFVGGNNAEAPTEGNLVTAFSTFANDERGIPITTTWFCC
jgi:hypothetical protein